MNGLRKVPMFLFVPGLLLFIVAGYYIGGACGDGKTVFDFYYNIMEIIDNPLRNYFNGKYTLISVMSMILLYFFLFYITRHPGKNICTEKNTVMRILQIIKK